MDQYKEEQQTKLALKLARKNSSIRVASALFLIVGTMLMASTAVTAMSLVDQFDQSQGKQPSVTLAVIEQPEIVVRILENLLRSILYSATVDVQAPNTSGAQKRGLDLGISRGFSGSQAGKHLMGLSAASFANGPGRR